MDKLYELIEFINRKKPALNADNLNKISRALNDIDDRVIEEANERESEDVTLKALIEAYEALAVENIFYNPYNNTLGVVYGSGRQEDIGPIEDARINTQLIFAGISPSGTSDALAAFGISCNLTAIEVFNKLPAPATVIAYTSSQHSVYADSFPVNEGAAQQIYSKVEIGRGNILYLPIHGSRVWIGIIINGEIFWEEIAKTADMAAYLPLSGGTISGSLAVQGTVTASAFKGNASSATQAESAKLLAGWADTRDVATKPNDYNAKLLPVGIKRNTITGLLDGGAYATLVGTRGWGDASGGKAHELGFTANGKIYHRVGDTDTWEPWREIAHTDDLNAGGTGDATTKVSKSGDTMTGDLVFADSGTSPRGIRGTMGGNDAWRVIGGATASNAGFLEIATADDNNEPIYVRQYKGVFNQLIRTLTLLDGNGNTSFPGTVTAPAFSGTATHAQYVRTGTDVRNTLAVRSFNSGGNTNQGAIFLQEDLANALINVGIDGLGPVGVNLARNAYNDSAGNNIVNTYATKAEVALHYATKAEVALQFVGEQIIDAWSAAETVTFPNTMISSNFSYIIVGEGASSTSSTTGDADYGRVIFATLNWGSGSNVWVTSTLGSYYSGSTARFSVDKTEGDITIKVPKGSWARIKLFQLKSS